MKHSLMVFFFFCFGTFLLATEPVAVLTNTTGEIMVQRGQDTTRVIVKMFDDLFEGDSLFTGTGEATVLYQNGRIVTIGTENSLFITCTNDSVRGQGDENGLFADVQFNFSPLFAVGRGSEKVVPKVVVRAPEDSLRLTIFTPGNTSLFTARPEVVWSSFSEANWYAVIFQKRGEVIINNATTDTVMPYFDQNEDLESAAYLVRVLAFHDKDTLTCQQCFIQIIDSSEAEEIQELTTVFDKIDTDVYTSNFLKALFYEDHSLLNHAIEHYQNMRAIKPDDPFAYKALACLYSKLGLPDQANLYVDQYEVLTNDN